MPLYHFDVQGCDEPDHHDGEGTELLDLAAARQEALRYAGELIGDLGLGLWAGRDWTLNVTDGERLVLFRLTLFATAAPCLAAND